MSTATTTAATAATPITTTTRRFPLLKSGAAAGAVTAATTTALAAVAHAAGVSFADSTGAAIPLLGFTQVTFVCALLGVALAAGIRRRARHPQRTFTRSAWTLAAVSCFAPPLAGVDATAVAVLVALHLVAAAMIVPALSSRLPR